MLRVAAAGCLLISLSGCGLGLLDATLTEAAAGLAETEAVTFAARGSAVSESLVVSDELGASFRSLRFSSAIRGQLSDSLAQLTQNGARAARLQISSTGVVEGNGYIVARFAPNGMIYTPRGARLGLITRQASLLEYTRDGKLRQIGYVRGIISGRSSSVFKTGRSSGVIRQLRANSIVKILRVENGGYIIILEDGTIGWIAGTELSVLTVLSLTQFVGTCGHETGAVVTTSNRLIVFERCEDRRTGLDVVRSGQVFHVPRDAVSEIWKGDIGGNGDPKVRGAVLLSLRTDGVIYPPPQSYRLYPEGDSRKIPPKDKDLMEAPQ